MIVVFVVVPPALLVGSAERTAAECGVDVMDETIEVVFIGTVALSGRLLEIVPSVPSAMVDVLPVEITQRHACIVVASIACDRCGLLFSFLVVEILDTAVLPLSARPTSALLSTSALTFSVLLAMAGDVFIARCIERLEPALEDSDVALMLRFHDVG